VRIARFTTGEDPVYGVVHGEVDELGIPAEDATLVALAGDPLYVGLHLTEEEHKLADVRLLAPVADVIYGYTIGNDVTARDLQRSDVQFTRAKGFDSFCPLGPWIETELDSSDLRVQTHLNGDLKQDGSTKDMIFDVTALVAYVSSVMTLLPGDVILTGTPEGVGPMNPGDEVDVTIERIGTLTNKVVARG
jgi:fumarylacetoacetate (FAA) hydrolase family protein